MREAGVFGNQRCQGFLRLRPCLSASFLSVPPLAPASRDGWGPRLVLTSRGRVPFPGRLVHACVCVHTKQALQSSSPPNPLSSWFSHYGD